MPDPTPTPALPTAAELDELERLEREATPGPCTCDHKAHPPGMCGAETSPAYEDGNSLEPAEYCECGKVPGIAYRRRDDALRNAAPRLLAAARMVAEAERLRDAAISAYDASWKARAERAETLVLLRYAVAYGSPMQSIVAAFFDLDEAERWVASHANYVGISIVDMGARPWEKAAAERAAKGGGA